MDTSKPAEFTKPQIQKIRDYYSNTSPLDFDLGCLALELGKSKANVCRKARRLGLSNTARPLNRAQLAAAHRPRWQDRPHPRGMLGKKHSEQTKILLRGREWSEEQRDMASQRGVLRWHALSKEQKASINEKHKVSWKGGWREIGGVKSFYRSRWEANYGRYLEWLRVRGEITSWEHEPETFWFDDIKRGTRSYLPDFKVVERGKTKFHEVKGWMDPKSITKLKRMKKYHPSIEMVLIQKKEYAAIAAIMKPLIPDWE